jgi:hypothetical protein
MKTMIDLGPTADDMTMIENETEIETRMVRDDTDEGKKTMIPSDGKGGEGAMTRLTKSEKRGGDEGERGRGKIGTVVDLESRGGLIREKGRRRGLATRV